MRLERMPRGENAGETRENFHAVGRGAKDAASLPRVAGCLLEVRFTDEDAGVPERVCHGLTLCLPLAWSIIRTSRPASNHCRVGVVAVAAASSAMGADHRNGPHSMASIPWPASDAVIEIVNCSTGDASESAVMGARPRSCELS